MAITTPFFVLLCSAITILWQPFCINCDEFSEFDDGDWDFQVQPERIAEVSPTSLTHATVEEDSAVRAGNWDEFEDEEEFIGVPKPSPKVEMKSPKKSGKPSQDQPLKKPTPKDWRLEAGFGVFLVMYAINYFIGRRMNAKLAQQWYEVINPILEKNFSRPGFLDRISANEFSVTATGRIHCRGLQATLRLRRRQELFLYVLDLFQKKEETLTIEIPLLNMEPFVFAVGHPKSIKELQEKYTDLTDFAKKVQARNIPDSLQVLTESVDVADALFTKQVMLTLEKYESTFQYAFVTDQSNINPHFPKMLRFQFVYGKQEIKLLFRMAIHFIDAVSRLRLSKQSRADAQSSRAKLEMLRFKSTHNERQERAQQRKLEKLRREKENLSEEELIRKREKEQQRRMRKRQGKMKIVMG